MRYFFLVIGQLTLALAAACGALAQAPPTEPLITERAPGRPGGQLVAALRAEPRTWNPLLAVDAPALTVLRRMHADLVTIARDTQQTAAALAKSWSLSPDGRTFRLELRRGLRFSDGEPCDAEDVVFSFQALLDPAVGSPSRDLLPSSGEPPRVRALGSHTVELVLPRPYAAGERLFDSLAILPEHRLGAVWRAGKLAAAWAIGTDPAQIAGLGPFRLLRHLPGERIELERNPFYWKTDRAGTPLPYLERLVFVVVPNEQTEVLRFEAGEIDVVSALRAASYGALADRAGRRGLHLEDLGPGLAFHALFFNLNELAASELAEIRRKQRWFRDLAFRRAVSLVLDRAAMVELVYGGRARALGGPVTAGNKLWRNTELAAPRRSLESARAELAAAGFRRGEDGRLRDGEGAAVGFTIITNASNDERVQMATIAQDDLRQLGIDARVVPLEFRAVIDRVTRSFDYEACLLGFGGGDADPNPGMSLWLSSGASHLWHLGQTRPATPWEAEIDTLMQQQLVELDPAARKRQFDRVQAIVAEQLPLIPLVGQNVLVGARRALGNFSPAVLEHATLWNAEELYWHPPTAAGAER